MSLIQCSECRREISDRAVSCPGCGAPVAPDRATTIEQTSKRWKSWALVGALALCAGIVLALVGAAPPGRIGAIIAGTVIATGGAITWIVAKIGAWWHHG